MILPLGIAAFVVFYVVFRFMITKFDLKTPGREDDDDDAEKGAKLENNDYTEVARIVLEGVGGKENIESIDNCITRLRLEIGDYTKVDEKRSNLPVWQVWFAQARKQYRSLSVPRYSLWLTNLKNFVSNHIL